MVWVYLRTPRQCRNCEYYETAKGIIVTEGGVMGGITEYEGADFCRKRTHCDKIKVIKESKKYRSIKMK